MDLQGCGPACPECGGLAMIDTPAGITCRSCGLVVDETREFACHEAMGKDGPVKTSAVLVTSAPADWKRLEKANPALNSFPGGLLMAFTTNSLVPLALNKKQR